MPSRVSNRFSGSDPTWSISCARRTSRSRWSTAWRFVREISRVEHRVGRAPGTSTCRSARTFKSGISTGFSFVSTCSTHSTIARTRIPIPTSTTPRSVRSRAEVCRETSSLVRGLRSDVAAVAIALSSTTGFAADFAVTRYGAVADGVSDSTPGIQAAIDAAARAGGGRVVFPPATAPYLVRDSIRVSSSDIEIQGAGARILLAAGAFNGRIAEVLRVAGTEERPIGRVVVRGLTIDANYFDQVGARGSKAVVFRFVEHSRIEDVAITRAYVGLSLRRSVGMEARRVTVTDYQEDGFDAGGDADLVSGGITRGTSFVDVVARDAPRAAVDGNAFEIEDGVDGVLIQDAVVENVAGSGVGLRNHDTGDHINHSSDVELRNVTLRKVGGAFAVFASARPTAERAVNSYRRVRLINVVAESAVAFWGPLQGIELTGGRYASIYLGFNSGAAAATSANALAEATLTSLDAAVIRINGGSGTVKLTGVRAATLEQVRSQ